MSQAGQRRLSGTGYVVRQQLYTIHENFEVFDAGGSLVMSAHGNGLRVMEKIDLHEAATGGVLELRQRAGVRSKVEVKARGKKLFTIGERRVGIRDHFVIDTPLPAKFEIVGNPWSTSYVITIDGEPAAQVMMEPGLVKADTYNVIIGEGRKPGILIGLVLAVDILAHQGKR